MRSFQQTLRPIHEWTAAGGWAAGASVTGIGMLLSPLPDAPFAIAAGLCLSFGLVRAGGGIARLRARRRLLRGRPLSFIDIGELNRRTSRDSVWLGWGYEWAQEHRQLADELLGASSDVVGGYAAGGARWIHGLEPSEGHVRLPISAIDVHTCLVGTTGSGKTRILDLLVTQAIFRQEPVIIIDPKGDRDLAATARRACAASGRPDAFLQFHPAMPTHSVRLDPLRSFGRPTELASRIAALISTGASGDPFKAYAHLALVNVIAAMLMAGDQPSLTTIRGQFDGGVEELVVAAIRSYAMKQELGDVLEEEIQHQRKAAGKQLPLVFHVIAAYRKRIASVKGSTELEGVISQFEHDRVHFSKMVASLAPVLAMLTSSPLDELLSPDRLDHDDARPILDMQQVITDKLVLWVGLDALSDPIVGSAIGSLLLADLTAVAGDRYNRLADLNRRASLEAWEEQERQSLERRINLVVDEAAEVINEPLIQLLNKGRGARVSVTLATQTIADFTARLGDEARARQVLANVGTIIALKILDNESQQYICEGLRSTKVDAVEKAFAISDKGEWSEYSGGSSERMISEDTELVPPNVLGILPPLESFIRMAGGAVWKLRSPILIGGKGS